MSTYMYYSTPTALADGGWHVELLVLVTIGPLMALTSIALWSIWEVVRVVQNYNWRG